MPDPTASDEWVEAVDRALREWRQGDCVLGAQELAYRFDPNRPVTPGAKEAAAEVGDVDIAVDTVHGLVVLSQSCDIVSPLRKVPFVEVAALVEVSADELRKVEKRELLRYAFLPGTAERRLVVDLSRTMVVEKPVVSGWTRIQGCQTDDESRRFADALARKHARAGLPDDFNRFAGPLLKLFDKRAGKDSSEGRAVDALDEIRVLPRPAWNAKHVDVEFFFIRAPGVQAGFEGRSWDEYLECWLALLQGPSESRFKVQGVVTTLAEMTAEEYVASDRLDYLVPLTP